MGCLDSKGAYFQSKGQGIKVHKWCCVVNNGMLIKYFAIKFLEYVPRLITWPTYIG